MLSEIKPRTVAKNQQRALLRLQLRFTAETHRLILEYQEYLAGVILRSADSIGMANGVSLFQAQPMMLSKFDQMFEHWVALFERAREQAASIPFGGLVVMNNAMFKDQIGPMEERWAGPREVGTVIRMWQARRQRALDAAASRIYSDGFNLSGRVWALQNGGRDEIRRIVSLALSERTSAAELARLVEPLLGANQELPRWTMQRLYKMTPADRLADLRGLLRSEESRSKGLAYKALRMARNEIQIAHQRMSDEIYAHSPWVNGVEVRLSAQHPEPDICDEVAEAGPYEVGEVTLPLHVQCMCYQHAVVMDQDQFSASVGGWLRGENHFLDNYQNWSGIDAPVGLDWRMSIAESLELWLSMGADGHAEALGL